MSDEALISAIEKAESESYGSGLYGNDGQLSDDRARALDAYFGRNTFPAPEGNSQVISRDLFDTVETILPSLTRIFAGADEVVRIEPVGPDDVEQAQQESLYLNHLISQRNQWEQVFHDWAWDALVTKNAYCLAWWDDSKQVEYETYARQSDDAFVLLMQEEGIEVLEHSAELDEEAAKALQAQFEQQMGQWEQMAMQAAQMGQEPPPPPEQPPAPLLHAVKIRRTKDQGKLCLRVLPPERCMVHESTSDYTLKDCDFFEYWEETTISKLRTMGFDIPDDIADDGGEDTEEDQARDQYHEWRTGEEGWEPSMRKVRVCMVWIRHDYDKDGIAELQYVLKVGKTVLYREECNRIPVASIVATPVPHRHMGLSIADVVMDIQEVKTMLIRQGIDNLFLANNPRMFVNGRTVDLDSALISRPGGIVQAMPGENPVFGQDLAPIVIPNVFPQAVQGLEYMDQVREGRTGTNRYFSGTDQNSLNKTATGIQQLTSMAAQRVEQIARMIAPAVEYLFSVCHELILKHGHKAEVVRLRGEWVNVDPSGWRKRTDLKIAVGLGSGSREGQMGHLNNILMMQMQTMPLGITNPELIYNTLAELTKAAGFPTESMFWQKPGPPQPPGPPPEVMLEQMRQQFEAQKVQMQEQSKAQIAQMQAEMDRLKLEADAANAERERELKARITEMQESTKLTIAQMNQEHASQMETFKAQNAVAGEERQVQRERETKAQEDRTPEVIQQMQETMAAIAQMVQGSRAVGIQRITGPDGKRRGYRVARADGSVEEVPIQ